jgi:chemotaxis protein methyltransferase CheR
VRKNGEEFSDSMSESERIRISGYVEKKLGIKMPHSKKHLLAGRLMKRLRDLNFKTFDEYFEYVLRGGNEFEELVEFTDLVTTHETKFFRESSQYEILGNVLLPEIYNSKLSGGSKQLKIFSAASSTGEEVYSIAIAVEEFKRLNNCRDLDYEITGADVSLKSIRTAGRAIYSENRISTLPRDIIRRYFMKSRDNSRQLVKVVPEVRKNVNFVQANLIDDEYQVKKQFHIIFCCNVLIYFDKDNQTKACRNLIKLLYDGGYFVIGKSETLFGLKHQLKNIRPSVYCKG